MRVPSKREGYVFCAVSVAALFGSFYLYILGAPKLVIILLPIVGMILMPLGFYGILKSWLLEEAAMPIELRARLHKKWWERYTIEILLVICLVGFFVGWYTVAAIVFLALLVGAVREHYQVKRVKAEYEKEAA